ncbi:MAG TPA: carboxypeptidase regulatory-like domain-containing protein, partial [Bryobacteraceae bacterium]|nr:carboxypeptidase regulatory-like domain-containing protein [Bryobacteraceae bacterium]
MKSKSIYLAASLLFFCAGDSRAQTLYGSLVGSVTDSAAAAIPNATVEATNTGTGFTKRARTDERGGYLFNDLQPGLYDVKVSAPAFSTFTKTGVQISINTIVRADVQLQVGAVTENITVSAQASVLQTDRSDVNQQIGGRQVQDLPLPGMRNFQALLKLVPGMTPPRSSNSDFANPQASLVVNTNGSSFSTNNTRLDGAGNTYVWLPHHAAYIPSADAVETVNVVTNSFDAEQGLAGGAVVNVNIKSGTNEFHGSAFEYHTNSKLRARNFFNVGNRLPKNILNQYGFTIGGPVLKNKLFFFGDFEGTKRRQNASGFGTLPTDAIRAGDFGAAGANIYDPRTGSPDGSGRELFPGNRIPTGRMDPAALKLVGLLPAQNLTGDSSNFFYSEGLQFNRDTGDIKVNFNPTQRIQMFGRYSILDFFIFDPQIFGLAGGDPAGGGQPGNGSGRIQSFTLGATVVFTPHFLMDAHAGYTRRSDAQTALDFGKNFGLETLGIPGTNGTDIRESGIPRFNISGYSGYGNLSTSSPSFHIDSQFVYNFNFGYTHGSHNLRWGVDIDRQHMNHWQPEVGGYGPRGGFNFTGGATSLRGGAAPNRFNSYADFLLGLPIDFGKSREEFGVMSTRGWAEALYIRDQWQTTRNLTVNYGLRWEYYPFATRDHRGLERYDPATNQVLLGGIGNVPTDTGVEISKRNFGPRLGIAYRLHQKWVLRAGYGISIDPYPFSRPLRDNYPTVTNSQFQGSSSLEPGGSLRLGIPVIPRVDVGNGVIAIPAVATTNTLDKVFRRGYVQSFNATAERELGGGFTGRVSYVGTRGIRQMVFININAAAPGTGAAGRELNRRFGRTADTRAVTPFRTANYNAFQAHAERRFANGFQFT